MASTYNDTFNANGQLFIRMADIDDEFDLNILPIKPGRYQVTRVEDATNARLCVHEDAHYDGSYLPLFRREIAGNTKGYYLIGNADALGEPEDIGWEVKNDGSFYFGSACSALNLHAKPDANGVIDVFVLDDEYDYIDLALEDADFIADYKDLPLYDQDWNETKDTLFDIYNVVDSDQITMTSFEDFVTHAKTHDLTYYDMLEVLDELRGVPVRSYDMNGVTFSKVPK